MEFIDCKSVRNQILNDVRKKVSKIRDQLELVIIHVGRDDASEVYLRNKFKTAREVGIYPHLLRCDEHVQLGDLKYLVQAYSEMDHVTGIMIQLPLPDHLKEHTQELLDLIPWQKDVDGLSSESVGRLWNGRECIVPATPSGVMKLLPKGLSGKTVCIVNRSNLIGRPLAKLLMDRNATVTVCHSKTDPTNMRYSVGDANIVITGIGKPRFFDKKWFSEPQTLIDCGINRDDEGHLCGDIDIDSLSDMDAISVTPVPGGVGILTTAQLMANVVKAYEFQKRGKK